LAGWSQPTSTGAANGTIQERKAILDTHNDNRSGSAAENTISDTKCKAEGLKDA